MASLSLPRVLQLKKNSVDAEREQFEKFQTLAIQKAINSVETPVKEKHVRSTIIGTFQEQSAATFWMVALRLPMQENRIVAWKFCHVTHKLLREGHPACLDDSQRHVTMIENLGKLWVHLREGYGKLVHLYCNLLVCKLKFHRRNPRFPGNMQLTAEELDAAAENDINNYFQLCVELFDYMDELLNLQAAVFDSLGNARANSMTASGQCRLAALIPCAQDASQLYDCNVRLLFRLHASLPADTLAGHRDRFRQQFKKLSSFYKHASSLQYYRNLLSLPVLPSNPPNFLQQSDFGTYVTPVVSIPEQPPDRDEMDAVGSLIDTSDTISQATTPESFDAVDTRTTPSPQPDPIVERDRLIEHLQNELKRMRSEISQMVQERNTMITSMKSHCARLETQLHSAKTELDEEKQKAEVLSAETPEIKQKLTETEEKSKILDEKFQKLKGAYTQLREEHIRLIRQKAEVDKSATNLRSLAAQHESAKTALQQQLNDKMKDVEILQQSASSSEEIEAYKQEIANLRSDVEQARQKDIELEALKASMETLQIEHKTSSTEQEEKIQTVTNELKEALENLEKCKLEKEERDSELSRVKLELTGIREKNGDEFRRVLEEKEAALMEIADITLKHQQEKEEQEQIISDLEITLDMLKDKLTEVEKKFANESAKVARELTLKNQEFEVELNKRDIDLNNALRKLESLHEEFEFSKDSLVNKARGKDEEVKELQLQINNLIKSKDVNNTINNQLQSDNDNMKIKLLELKSELEVKNAELNVINIQLKEAENKQQIEFNLEMKILREFNFEMKALKDKLQYITDTKDEIISDLKAKVDEKDQQVVALNVDVTRLSQDNIRLMDELNEANAELEMCKNEFVTLREEHDNIVCRNEVNLSLKNQELRSLHEEIQKLTKQQTSTDLEHENIINDLRKEKKELQITVTKLQELKEKLCNDNELTINEKNNLENIMNDTFNKLQAEYEKFKIDKYNEIELLKQQLEHTVIELNKEINDKNDVIAQQYLMTSSLNAELNELRNLKTTEIDNINMELTKFESESQILQTRLQHTDDQRVNAECELQDLLQHNTVLEADVAALKRKLEESQNTLKLQTSKLVSVASETSLSMTEVAISALDRASAVDSSKVSADCAARALDRLEQCRDVQGNEESIARAALHAAHNSCIVSAYVADVANSSTDLELAEKLTTQCRGFLTTTKSYLDSLKTGVPMPQYCSSAREQISTVLEQAARGDTKISASWSVDDELAEMDKAIEQAAAQIESLLAASRAADSGIQLEVNGKILDACTALMAAVRVLVQNARTLQNEIGDTKTRQKLYRRNPQWSEGLISAAKAVVFAAKLLVTSADEAVGSGGSIEGVSAAAHEVAGSTAQLVAASRARAAGRGTPALAALTAASRQVAAAAGALLAAARTAAALRPQREALDTSNLTLTATRRLEMESKVRALELETALDAERARLAALRKRHYQLAQTEENGEMPNGNQ